MSERFEWEDLPKYIFIIAFIIYLIFSLVVIVGAGNRGVVTRFGAVTGKIFGEGLHFKIPIVEGVRIFDVKVQKEQTSAAAASKDLQTVSSEIALNYHVNPMSVAKIYQEVGIDYKGRIIEPALQEAVKATTAKYTAEELITKREQVRDDIKLLIKTKIESKGFYIDEFNIVNFDFSESFNSAIEAKVTAEQSALAARNKLEQIKFEAEQKIAEAKGKAEAITIESNALRNNPDILQLRALEKWDGKLPLFIGSGAVPFIDVKNIGGERNESIYG